jgi:hypothetical protein
LAIARWAFRPGSLFIKKTPSEQFSSLASRSSNILSYIYLTVAPINDFSRSFQTKGEAETFGREIGNLGSTVIFPIWV